jgi:hypothetical protein
MMLLQTPSARGKAEVQTADGHKVLCRGIKQTYPPLKAGEQIYARVNRKGGRVVDVVFYPKL